MCYVVVLLLGLLSCESEEKRITRLICNDDFKYWLNPNWDSEYHVFSSCYVRFGKDGSFGSYNFVRGGQFLPSEETDVLYPNHWELKDDSVIVHKKNHPIVSQWNTIIHEKKINYITKDTMILSYESSNHPGVVFLDTLVTPPDSIMKLLVY